MTDRICSVEGCDDPHHANGLCNKHRLRLRRTGTTDSQRVGLALASALTRFHASYAVDVNGCWLWTRPLGAKGYAYMGAYGGTVRVHRWAYEQFVGPVPVDLVLDHLCRVRHCVNPAHLEPVTVKENVMRGQGRAAANARKTHCPQGHEYSPENTYVPDPTRHGVNRQCRTCHRIRARERRAS